ncbi:hypothetical protein [Proteiniclasticum ruminis]|uniref:Uncharacterized protein n=1 Tax=Proteiniclasticum ruminis TaxID=398199 RepID=A0A1I4Z3N8_9CLOT|nr:hypothetical protein [Proteiniclasticum ruminis]SFN44599.1 hypothetical protein SAMN04488695_101914 [Proteiniclasticum ruminis]
MGNEKFYEKDALLKVLFMPIRDRLSTYVGSTMVEVKEKEGFLFVIFLTPGGKIELKCTAKRMAVTLWEVDLLGQEIQEILLRISFFLRRNEIQVLTIRKSAETKYLSEYLEKNCKALLLASYGKEIWYELRVMEFICKAQQQNF